MAKVAGVPHIENKSMPTAPKARQNLLNVRVSPIKRMVAAAPKIVADKPNNVKF